MIKLGTKVNACVTMTNIYLECHVTGKTVKRLSQETINLNRIKLALTENVLKSQNHAL